MSGMLEMFRKANEAAIERHLRSLSGERKAELVAEAQAYTNDVRSGRKPRVGNQ